jgi:tagatose 6-phosphate kinase
VILVVCLNPALDVTHHVAGVSWDGVNRPAAVRARPGGKGLNVARILRALHAEVQVIGMAGGVTGAAVRSGLASAEVPAVFTGVARETRRTFAVVDTERRQTALFNEPGPQVSDGEYQRFRAQYQQALTGCSAVVLSGSLPPGLPGDCYAELAGLAAQAGLHALLDTDGPALAGGMAGRPAIVKPNLAELERAAGRELQDSGGPDLPAVTLAARELMSAGAQSVVVTLGADGLLAVTGDGVWQGTPGGRQTGNPTGAGDAVIAGLAVGMVLGRPWEALLAHAVALGTAAVAAPAAGDFSDADYQRELAEVRISRREDL